MKREPRRESNLSIGALLLSALALLAAGSVSCSGQERPPRAATSIPVELRSAATEWDRLFDARDAAGLAALYAEDVVSMPYSAPTINGRQALQADFEKFYAKYNCRHETLVDEALASDEWGLERARYILTYTPIAGGPEVKETGRHVLFRKRVDGRWLIAWEIWNTDTPAQP